MIKTIQGLLVVVILGWAGLAEAQIYDLPFKGEDFNPGERVLRNKKIHSSSGVQKYGYDIVNGMQTENVDEQSVISLMHELSAHGDGCGRIATKLAKQGMVARNGKKFHSQTVKNILNYKH